MTTSATTSTHSVTTDTEMTDQSKVMVEETEVVKTTTTTTTVKTVTSSTTVTSNSTTDSKEPTSNGAKIIKITPEMSVEIFKNSNSNSSGKGSDTNTIVKSDLLGDKKEENKSTIMNVQSLIPNVKPTLLKVQDTTDSSQKQTRTVLIVNREGNKVTLAVSKQSITPDQNTPSTAIAMSRSLSNSVTTVSAAGM
jgi:hypothetical protein